MRKVRELSTKWRVVIASVLGVIVLFIVLWLSGVFSQALTLIFPGSVEYIAKPAHTTLQTFDGDDCAAMPTYTTLVLTDNRDGQDYRVRKMPDNRCWMIDNLKLAGGATLDAGNTNLDGSEPADFASTWATITAPVQSAATHSNGKCTADSTATLANGSGYLTCDGADYADANDGFIAYSDPAGTENNAYENCTAGTYNGTSEESLTGCGYLYNWYTATAGTGNYQKGSGTYASASICPAGWHLPNDFGVLNASMKAGMPSAGSTTSDATTYPNWFYNGPFQGSLAGYYTSGFSWTGESVRYWASSVLTTNNARWLSISYSGIVLGTSTSNLGNRPGFAIRCML
jgi:uncharacterized protein (TIGR02145 family)